MEKVNENLLLLCRNLQANGAQFFWDTLYNSFKLKPCMSQKKLKHLAGYGLKKVCDQYSKLKCYSVKGYTILSGKITHC